MEDPVVCTCKYFGNVSIVECSKPIGLDNSLPHVFRFILPAVLQYRFQNVFLILYQLSQCILGSIFCHIVHWVKCGWWLHLWNFYTITLVSKRGILCNMGKSAGYAEMVVKVWKNLIVQLHLIHKTTKIVSNLSGFYDMIKLLEG